MNVLQLKAEAELETRRRNGELKNSTVIGFVSPVTKLLTHAITNETGEWELTDDEPQVYLAEKLEYVVRSKKRFIAVIGGRGSSKSVGVVDIGIVEAKDENAKSYCLREFQSSIRNSVYSLIKDEIDRLEFKGFEVQQQSFRRDGEDLFQFAGIARNVSSIKSASGFQRFFVEEAQFLSQDSLDVLTPTARNKPNKGLPKTVEELEDADLSGVSMVFVANPESSEDPFSKRFIVPYQKELEADGIYEDDMHLIVVMNYSDNPWFDESGLEAERQWGLKHMSRAMYDHVWMGDYNDSVENSLIDGEWFDACVDAHKKKGWDIVGAKIASHDPSDTGDDNKGLCLRHGSLIEDVLEKSDGTVNEGSTWAVGTAKQYCADYYTWDCDGMGVALNEQVARDFKDKRVEISQFKGSESPDFPESIYNPAQDSVVSGQKANKDIFRNKRVQYYIELRDRVYRTYRCIKFGEYHDPDKMISFSGDMKLLRKLRAELCRMPVKPNNNGLIDLYTKQEMKSKFGFPSPNLADSVVMSLRYISNVIDRPYIPAPIGSMGLAGRHGSR